MYFHVILFYYGESIQKDEIQKQIEELRGEVRELSDSLTHLRRDDLRLVMGEQTRSVFMERIERFFADKKNMPYASPTEMEESERALIELLDDYIEFFQRGSRERALARLDAFETTIHGPNAPYKGAKFVEFADGLVEQLRSYLGVSDRVVLNYRSDELDRAVDRSVERPRFSPLTAESVLAPLSNSWRINILMMLSSEGESLAGLSKALKLKKGHLQFHLNALLEPGFIRYDKKSHLYSITRKGSAAYEGIGRLLDDVASSSE